MYPQLQMRIILSDQSVDFNNISVQLYDFRNVTAVRVEILPISATQGQQASRLLSDYVSSNFTMLGQHLVTVENRGVSRVVPSRELKSLPA